MRVRKTTIIPCFVCGTPIERCAAEVKRNAARGFNAYCSKKCWAVVSPAHFGEHLGKGNPDVLKAYWENHPPKPYDALASTLRAFVRRVRMRHAKLKLDRPEITLADLYSLWDKQNGICALTGRTMDLLQQDVPITPDRVSIDRIDCSRYYELDNIRFTTFMANLGRRDFTDEQFILFCRAVDHFQKTQLPLFDTNATDPTMEALPGTNQVGRAHILSPFMYHQAKTKSRNRKAGVPSFLTATQVFDLWKSQQGKCVLTGLDLFLPPDLAFYNGNKVGPFTASLDRIDSDKPYEPGNVQFICFMGNTMKGVFTNADVFEACSSVAATHPAALPN